MKSPENSLTASTGRPLAEVQQRIIESLAKELRISPESIAIDQSILSMGVDSVQIVSLMSTLEDWGGFRFPENPLEDHPTVRMLARYISGLSERPAAKLDR